jgi:RNA polymerase sigma factor (sigma-70 family)
MAWARLLTTYHGTMVGFARRVLGRWGEGAAGEDRAEEIVQDFLATCAAKGSLGSADPLRGRFRVFVKVLLRRHVCSHLRREQALRRRPADGRAPCSLDQLPQDPSDSTWDPAESDRFDRDWLDAVLERALARLSEESARTALIARDLVATCGEGSPDLALLSGVEPRLLAVRKHRAKERLRTVLAEELAETVGDESSLREEWVDLTARAR